MTSDRPYRKGLPVAAAVAEIERCAGTQFDPEVVAAILRAFAAGDRFPGPRGLTSPQDREGERFPAPWHIGAQQSARQHSRPQGLESGGPPSLPGAPVGPVRATSF